MKLIIILFLITLMFTACEKEIDIFKGQNGIYFDNKGILLDTVDITWGLKSSEITEQTIKLRVQLLGNVADYDRAFTIEVVSDPLDTLQAVEGVDYRPFPLEYKILANQAEVYIPVVLLRTPELKKTPRQFMIKLHETSELKFLYTRQTQVDSVTVRPLDTQRVIRMTEDFPMPWWWYRYGEDIFGTWSATKSILICDQMNIDREVWIGNLGNELTIGYLKFAGQYMHRWLQEHPTLDEDNEPMKMGPDSQV